MEERIRPTRSGLFAIELLIAVGIFTLCAAICVGLFVRAEVMSRNSADLNRAVAEARSAAECFKAAGGNLEETARLTGGELASGERLVLEYDANWNRLEPGKAGTYELLLLVSPGDGYAGASLSVKRYDVRDGFDPGESILAWDVAVLEAGS